MRRAVTGTGQPGWLRVELADGNGDGELFNNRILNALIGGRVPILGFEPQNGRLKDVFLDLTTKALK